MERGSPPTGRPPTCEESGPQMGQSIPPRRRGWQPTRRCAGPSMPRWRPPLTNAAPVRADERLPGSVRQGAAERQDRHLQLLVGHGPVVWLVLLAVLGQPHDRREMPKGSDPALGEVLVEGPLPRIQESGRPSESPCAASSTGRATPTLGFCGPLSEPAFCPGQNCFRTFGPAGRRS